MQRSKQIKTPEERIIEFVDHLKASGKIRFKKEFYEATGIRRQYFREVSIGNNRFTSTHISTICQKYMINANWIFGVETNMYRTEQSNKKGYNKRHIAIKNT